MGLRRGNGTKGGGVMDIEAIKADREAGTPGPWIIKRKAVKMSIETHIHQVTSTDFYPTAFVPAWLGEGPDDPTGAPIEAVANARRICHVPELEAAVIALQARVAELEALLAEPKP